MALAASAAPQEETSPLSAIPWLSDVVNQPESTDPTAPPPTPLVPPESIQVRPLPGPDPNGAGLRAPGPVALWASSEDTSVSAALRGMERQSLPAAQDLFTALLVAEAIPPKTPANGKSSFLLSRIDALLLMGALDPALALIERAGPEQPFLFQRWFDVALLTGYEKRACATMAATPSLAPTAAARVFCLAREGRWETAVVTLEATAALGNLSEEDAYRMARFLDPELFEGDPPMTRPEPVTPLLFRVHEALGEPIATRDLPYAFAHSDLRQIVGWKAQIEAAERLARIGSVPGNTLLGIYSARPAAASGGVWDRVEHMQALDIALNTGRPSAVTEALLPAHQAMSEAGLEMVMAEMIAPRLARLALNGEAARVALRLELLSNSDLAFEPKTLPDDLPPKLAFASALAVGAEAKARPPGPRSAALRRAFTNDGALEPRDSALFEENRIGEALLRALSLLAPGAEASPRDISRALAILRRADREKTARHAALQYLLSGGGP